MKLEFTNLPENNNNTTTASTTEFKIVKKGAQKLTVSSLESATNVNGNTYLRVTFHSERFDADFTDNFYTTPKALPKLLDLIEGFTGNSPESVDTDELSAMLVGKTANAIVDDEAYTKEKDGKTFTNYRPRLRFRDFASTTKEWKDEDARTTDNTAVKTASPSADVAKEKEKDDLPF